MESDTSGWEELHADLFGLHLLANALSANTDRPLIYRSDGQVLTVGAVRARNS